MRQLQHRIRESYGYLLQGVSILDLGDGYYAAIVSDDVQWTFKMDYRALVQLRLMFGKVPRPIDAIGWALANFDVLPQSTQWLFRSVFGDQLETVLKEAAEWQRLNDFPKE